MTAYEDEPDVLRHGPCACRIVCGDVPEVDDPYGVCKGLSKMPEPPLVRIVLVPRNKGVKPPREEA